MLRKTKYHPSFRVSIPVGQKIKLTNPPEEVSLILPAAGSLGITGKYLTQHYTLAGFFITYCMDKFISSWMVSIQTFAGMAERVKNPDSKSYIQHNVETKSVSP